jgi:hypothetical protein
MVVGTIVGHLLEIGLFAAAAALLMQLYPSEELHQALASGRFTIWHFSATSYTSLGGDLPPTGELRLLSAVEALTGLILITWSASFIFLLMQHFWGKDLK